MLKWESGFGIKKVIFYFDSYTKHFLLALYGLLENSEGKKFNSFYTRRLLPAGEDTDWLCHLFTQL
jgi:hypothetical protein